MKDEVVLFFSLAGLLCTVDYITSTTHDDRNAGFVFDNHPGYILSLPINMTNVKQISTKVSNKMDCVFACVETFWCRSVNFKITVEVNDQHICELIATDSYTNPKHLAQDETFIHLSIKNLCEDKPCLNGGNCTSHNDRRDYICLCEKGYTGKNCQNHCSESWLRFGNHCYFFKHDASGQTDWQGAVEACRNLGAHLIDIRNEDERLFVKSHLKSSPVERWPFYLIGMTDKESEGSWKYIDGKAVTFLQWGSAEPNGGIIENCGTIFTSTNDTGRYNDGPCTRNYGRFICKKKVAGL